MIMATNIPDKFKTNFATALLMTNNIDGCLNALAHVNDRNNATALRLYSILSRRQSTGYQSRPGRNSPSPRRQSSGLRSSWYSLRVRSQAFRAQTRYSKSPRLFS